MLLSQDTEPEIIYGVSFMRYLEIIWNSRITHPDLDILLFDDDDVKRVFRYSKYHPGVASAFSLILSNHLFIYMWSTFSSITSLENFEPITRARTRLVEHLSDSTYQLAKYKDIIEKIKLSDEPTQDTTFAQAVADKSNTGVENPNKTKYNILHCLNLDFTQKPIAV